MIAHAETVDLDPELLEGVGRLVRILKFDGVLQLQFIGSSRGFQLIDINPRVYASLPLAIAAGRNLPAIWADLLCGRPPRVGAYRTGVGFRSEVNDLRFAMRSARRGQWRNTLAVLTPRRNTTHAIFQRRQHGHEPDRSDLGPGPRPTRSRAT
jgi:predicted ATP-grasp superfamily ATP-dependent carboligase